MTHTLYTPQGNKEQKYYTKILIEALHTYGSDRGYDLKSHQTSVKMGNIYVTGVFEEV